tara:strand:- start:250 stop:492 length:243 start_codon:yes stop_codon:yes gene_type:complete
MKQHLIGSRFSICSSSSVLLEILFKQSEDTISKISVEKAFMATSFLPSSSTYSTSSVTRAPLVEEAPHFLKQDPSALNFL